MLNQLASLEGEIYTIFQLKDIASFRALRFFRTPVGCYLLLIDSSSPFVHKSKITGLYTVPGHKGFWTKRAGAGTDPAGEGERSAEFPLGGARRRDS